MMMPGNKFNRELVIVEVSAHSSGHYTEEIFYFCKTVTSEFPAIHIYTPYGFREDLIFPENCILHNVLGKENLKKNIDFISQVKFYFRTFKDKSKRRKDSITHIWGYKSIFPLFVGMLFLKKNHPVIFNVWRVNRARVSVFQKLKFLGSLQVFISDLLMKIISDYLIVHSDHDKNSLIDKGFNHKKIEVLASGIPGELYSHIKKHETREKLGLNPSAFILLYFGTIREEKCLAEVISLISSLTGEYYVYIVGDNKSGTEIQNIVSDFVIKKIGYISSGEKANYFIASDAVLVCHNKEFQGLSGVMLDAIEYEIPIIAKSPSNAGTVVEKFNAGVTINSINNKNIIDALGYIRINSSGIRNNLQNLKNEYSNKVVYQKYLDLYLKAIK